MRYAVHSFFIPSSPILVANPPTYSLNCIWLVADILVASQHGNILSLTVVSVGQHPSSLALFLILCKRPVFNRKRLPVQSANSYWLRWSISKTNGVIGVVSKCLCFCSTHFVGTGAKKQKTIFGSHWTPFLGRRNNLLNFVCFLLHRRSTTFQTDNNVERKEQPFDWSDF